MSAQIISADDPIVQPISAEKIAADRAAAQQASSSSDSPADPSNSFNTMADKLQKAMKEIVKTPAAAEKPTAPDDSDKIRTDSKAKPPVEDPADKTITSAKAADWKALKEKREAAEKAANEFKQKFEMTQKEYEEYRKKAVPAEEIEKIRAEAKAAQEERQRLIDQLEVVAIERSPKFTSYFDKKFNDAISIAKSAVGEKLAPVVEELLKLPPSAARKEQLNEIREELIGLDQGALDTAVTAYELARVEREDQLKNSKESFKKLKEVEMQSELASRQEAERRAEAAASSVLSVARETSESFKTTGEVEHDVFVKESEEFLQKFFRKQLTDTEVALLPVLARDARRYQDKVVPALKKQISELQAALKNYQGSSPSPSDGRDSNQNAGQLTGGFIEKFNTLWPQGNR